MSAENKTDKTLRPRRSALYMPGANARALEKARSLPADCLILDVEDAVAPNAKQAARDQICDALRDGGYGKREMVVRINALATPWGKDDVAAFAALDEPARPQALLAPKISTPEDIHAYAALMPDGMDLWIMIETPAAILNLQALAACAENSPLTAFCMGTNDLAKETGAALVEGRAPMQTALSLSVLAARQYGLAILDGVYIDIPNLQGLAAECQAGADMGFDGKTLIHPSHIDTANTMFGPSADDIEEARAIVAAFDDPANAGKGVVTVNGKMTEFLHRDMARRVLAVADAIEALEA
jgi:citrate lyase subunit beta/citryl-CoA lyase